MAGTEAKGLRTLLESIEILHSHGKGDFQDRVLAACQHLFPETCNSFELWDRATGAHEGALNVPYDGKNLEERFKRIGELAPTQNPSFSHIVAGVSEPLRISDFTTLRQLRRTEFYDIVFKPADIIHQVAIPVHTGTHLGGITFNKGGRRDFSKEDMERIRILGQHTALAHHASRILAGADAINTGVHTLEFAPLRRRGLTPRECHVLRWIGEGKRDREIAIILGISHRTVTVHVRSILTKLGVENRTSAAAVARRMSE